jgi:hypothetical protein
VRLLVDVCCILSNKFRRGYQPKHTSTKRRGRPAKRKADGVGETNGEGLKVAKRAKVAISSTPAVEAPAVGLKTRRAYARDGEKPSTHGKPISTI